MWRVEKRNGSEKIEKARIDGSFWDRKRAVVLEVKEVRFSF